VVFVGEVAPFGPSVAVDHGEGCLALYGGFTALTVGEGDAVTAGQPLGAAGGATLYFEWTQAGTPLDPAPLLPR
jgi:lipoprotein NlpD